MQARSRSADPLQRFAAADAAPSDEDELRLLQRGLPGADVGALAGAETVTSGCKAFSLCRVLKEFCGLEKGDSLRNLGDWLLGVCVAWL